MTTPSWWITLSLRVMLWSPVLLEAQQTSKVTPIVKPGGDIPKSLAPVNADFDRREVMIPMRDGVKLYTVVLVPKGATSAPIVLTRTPSPIPAGEVQQYKFRMPTVNHVFQPGHWIMVQIQSSLFPYYDRNPQTYVPNIFLAKASDYQTATVTLERGGTNASRVWLPVVPVDQSAVMAR